jgi:hypothetical protein
MSTVMSVSVTLDRACLTTYLSLQEHIGSLIQADVLLFLEKGAALENYLLRQVQEVLPADMAAQIPVPAVPAKLRAREGRTMQDHKAAMLVDSQHQNPSVSSSTLSAEAGSMPSPDSRSAAAIVELNIAVSDVRVRIMC